MELNKKKKLLKAVKDLSLGRGGPPGRVQIKTYSRVKYGDTHFLSPNVRQASI